MFFVLNPFSVAKFGMYIPNFGMHVSNFGMYVPNFEIEKSHRKENFFLVSKKKTSPPCFFFSLIEMLERKQRKKFTVYGLQFTVYR